MRWEVLREYSWGEDDGSSAIKASQLSFYSDSVRMALFHGAGGVTLFRTRDCNLSVQWWLTFRWQSQVWKSACTSSVSVLWFILSRSLTSTTLNHTVWSWKGFFRPLRVLSRSCVSWVQDGSCLWDADSSFLSPRPWVQTAAADLQLLATQLHPENLAKTEQQPWVGQLMGGMGHDDGSGKVQRQKQHLSCEPRTQHWFF